MCLSSPLKISYKVRSLAIQMGLRIQLLPLYISLVWFGLVRDPGTDLERRERLCVLAERGHPEGHMTLERPINQ